MLAVAAGSPDRLFVPALRGAPMAGTPMISAPVDAVQVAVGGAARLNLNYLKLKNIEN